MTDRVDAKNIAPGAKVTAVVTESGRKPEKKDVINGGAYAIATGIIKWIEIHAGIAIPYWAEVFLVTLATTAASYFTKERLTGPGFFRRPTAKDVMTFVVSLVATSAAKAYEELTGADWSAEREIFAGLIVGWASSLISTKNVEVVTLAPGEYKEVKP